MKSVREKAAAYLRWLQTLTLGASVEIQNSWDDFDFYSGSRTPGQVVALAENYVTVEFEQKGGPSRKVFSRKTGREGPFAHLAPVGNEVSYSAEIGVYFMTMEAPVRRGDVLLEPGSRKKVWI